MIALVYRDELPEAVARELDQMIQGLTTGMLYVEHTPEGKHTNITCDSITVNAPDVTNGVAGTITFKDRRGNTVVISRNDSGVFITVTNGQTVTFRFIDITGNVVDAVTVGEIAVGGGAAIPGVEIGALSAAYEAWAERSNLDSANPCWELTNVTHGEIFLRARRRGGNYEVMPYNGKVFEVNLGSSLDSSQQGFFDNGYIKQLYLRTAGPQSARAGLSTAVAFSAGNFTANGAMTWTVGSGDQVTYAYDFVGPKMTVSFWIDASSIGGTPDTTLQIAIPGGFTAQRSVAAVGYGVDGGAGTTPIRIEVDAAGTKILINRLDGAVWQASADATYVRGQISFPVEL